MRQSQLAILLFLALVGCTKEKREVLTSSGSSGPTGPATLSTIQEDVFRLGCGVSGCHDNRANPAANLSLTTADRTYNDIVNQPSIQTSGLKLVIPGDSDHSYFIDKLRGTHLLVGGTGDRMPQYAAALREGDLERIIAWVDAGAQRN